MFEVALVNSTAIAAVAYNRSTSVMRIVFRGNTGYDYFNVSPEMFEALADARSVGSTFRAMNLPEYERLSQGEVISFLMECFRANNRVMVSV